LEVEFEFPSLSLGVGSYSVAAALHAGPTHVVANFDWWDNALVFQIVRGDQPLCIGTCALEVAVRWTSRESNADAVSTPAGAEVGVGGALR
jgi:homopolymeric O-antigen transport system ATP-binding protein